MRHFVLGALSMIIFGIALFAAYSVGFQQGAKPYITPTPTIAKPAPTEVLDTPTKAPTATPTQIPLPTFKPFGTPTFTPFPTR